MHPSLNIQSLHIYPARNESIGCLLSILKLSTRYKNLTYSSFCSIKSFLPCVLEIPNEPRIHRVEVQKLRSDQVQGLMNHDKVSLAGRISQGNDQIFTHVLYIHVVRDGPSIGGGGGGALPALVPSCVGHVCRPPINLLDDCKVLLDYFI